jgi:hypothetical protein
MADADRTRLAGRVQADYDGFGYAALFVDDLNAVAAVGNDVADDAATAATAAATTAASILTQTALDVANAGASAAAAAVSLSTSQAITGAVQGIGTAPLMVPRNAELPPAPTAGLFPIVRGASYQITPHDAAPRVLIAASGTLTWTLPLLSQLDPGWSLRVWNRSGNTLTINRAGTDVIGAADTSVTVANGTGVTLAYGEAGARFERVA